MNPLAIPAHGKKPVRKINQWLLAKQIRSAMKHLGFQNPINWVFNPVAAQVAGTLGEELVIYYCVDEFSAFSGVAAKSIAEMDRQLAQKADAVFVSSQELLERKKSFNPNTFLVRHGVDVCENFRSSLNDATTVPEELAKLPKPVIGYFGLIADDWVDVDLLVHVARSLPHASIVMLGKITMDVSRLKDLPNVHLLGRKPYASLPAYCKGFDVAIVPFPINAATLNSNPLKAREYLAAGVPVISHRNSRSGTSE